MLLVLTGSSCAGTRDPGRWDAAAVDAYLGWAAWHRGHARDPRHRPDVVTGDGWSEMVWQRWAGWTAGDPRWRTHLIDTTDRPVAASVDEVERWVGAQRDAHHAGRLPLARGWAEAEVVAQRPVGKGPGVPAAAP